MSVSKTILMILALSFISCTINAQYLREQKLIYNISLSKDSVQKLSPKSPLLAGTLSFIVPGFALGQFYNGQTNKFFVHSLISFGLATAWGIHRKSFKYFGIVGAESIDLFGGLLIIIYATNWIWSTVDAVVSANNINKQIKLQKYHSDIIDKLNFGITVNKNKQYNLKFAFDL